jgi:hypothetical protein
MRSSVKRVERESGKRVSAFTVAPDGTKRFEFGEPDAPKPDPFNPWDAIYSETDQKRPS